jgi:transcriptional regulator with PAS, ATPase and Fis domain
MVVSTHSEYEPVEEVQDMDDIIVTPEPTSNTPNLTMEEMERETIRRSLQRNNGSRKMAAVELNISERTLYRKIKEYGL